MPEEPDDYWREVEWMLRTQRRVLIRCGIKVGAKDKVGARRNGQV